MLKKPKFLFIFLLNISLSLGAQSIDHLVRIHSAKNTEMRPLDVERVDEHIYRVYEYIHRDYHKPARIYPSKGNKFF